MKELIYLPRWQCSVVLSFLIHFFFHIWAEIRQNQQSDCAPSEDSDQPGHLPSLIRVFAVRMKKAWVLSYLLSVQRRLWSDWVDAQADVSLRWAHNHFVGFVMSQLIFPFKLLCFAWKSISASNVKPDVSQWKSLSQLLRIWYLSHRRPAKEDARALAVRTHKVWK